MLSSWYFQSPSALSTMIGRPLRCNPPVDLLSALFGVSVRNLDCCASNLRAGSPEVRVVCRLANENDTQAFLLSLTLMLRSPSLARVSTQ